MIDPLVGQTLGQYELQDRLGRGGMAAVYRAIQPSLGRCVASKVSPLGQLPDPLLPERLNQRELPSRSSFSTTRSRSRWLGVV
jgi:serine/threonine protein kinase